MEVSVRQLRDNLSKCLRSVRAGEDIVITARGEPVARLTAAVAPADPEAEAIARLRAASWVQAGTGGRVEGSSAPIPWAPGERCLSDLVAEDRD
ncbi:MAG: type II toxin-antitoxin system Phd/YefM family antitoxin [Deferrisomatales bacterium]